MEPITLVMLGIVLFTIIILVLNVATLRKNEEILFKVNGVKNADNDFRLHQLTQHEMQRLCEEDFQRGSLRIIHAHDLVYLTMMALKYSEITESKAAALLGLPLTDFLPVHNQWHKDGYRVDKEFADKMSGK